MRTPAVLGNLALPAVFTAIPEDRLLVETDAPDLRPPDHQNSHPLHDETGAPVNHPANIEVA